MKNVIKLLSFPIFLTGFFLFFSIFTNAQRNAFGSYINVEFNMDQEDVTAPDLLPGFFFQFPIKKNISLISNFSFGKKKYYSRKTFDTFNSTEILITQYFEKTVSFEQIFKCYFYQNPGIDKSNLYFGLGYSIRSPIDQQGENRSTRVESFNFFRKQELSSQLKLNIAFGLDYFLYEKIFLSFETGIQTPINNRESPERPILVRNNILFFNLKMGVQLHQIIFNGSKQPEYINIKDLEIKN